MKKIVLASKSVQRKKVLEKHGYKVLVDVSHADEHSVKEKVISKLVVGISLLKAQTVAKRHPNSIIVAADTVVFFDGKVIGQQHSDEDARKTLKALLGETHSIYTGMTVINTSNGVILHDVDKAQVTLNEVSHEILDDYIKSGLYKGKAGAYCIDEPTFKPFIEKIKGNREGILGINFNKIDRLIKKSIKQPVNVARKV